MRVRKTTFLLACLVITCSAARVVPKSSDPETAIRAILTKAYPEDEPGAAAIAVRAGEEIFKGAFGMADLDLAVPAEPHMVYRLGSITKQFTAAAIMLLQQRGELSVDDPISNYLPEYPTHGHTITIEHLLTHTSGIFSYTAIPGYMAQRVRADLTTEELIDAFKSEPMEFAPGEQWSYSNSGYVLLGAIIEEVSGQSYPDFMRENIFDPLNMENTYYGGPQVIPGRASGYQWMEDEYWHAPYLSMTQPHAAGGLLSSVGDLAKWDQALQKNRLLTAESFQRMTTPFTLNNGETTDYGYGFRLSEVRGHPAVEHGGGIFGFVTAAMRIPEEDIYVAILSNRTGRGPDPGIVARRIAARLLGDPFPEFEAVEIATEVLEKYVGVYKIDDDTQRRLTVEDGKLYTQRSGGSRLQAIPASETTFFYEDSLTYFEVEVDDQGQAVAMRMYQDGAKTPERAERVSKEVPERQTSDVDPALYDDYEGIFQLRPGFNITITREGDRLLAQATGQSQVEVFPESETRFFLKVVDAQITFVRNQEGTVDELILHQGGRNLTGRRVD